MRTKYGFFASVASLAIGFAGLFTSCEDECVNCNCDAFVVDYVVNADSMDVQLTQLTANTTIVIVGSGLSSTNSVCLVDEDNNYYGLPLNPTFVTDNAIVVTLDSDGNNASTTKLVVSSSTGCSYSLDIAKPVPAPSIKMFYSEFVPTGDTLRIAGNAFLDFPGDPVKVYFYNEKGEEIEASYKIANNNCELLVKVPEGVADSKPVKVKTHFGETQSSMLFRDTRNTWLDFDNTLASDQHGALDTFSFDWSPYVKGQATYVNWSDMVEAMGGMPKPCNGYYEVLTTPTAYNFTSDELIYLTPYSQKQEKVSLLGPFENEDLSNLVLKFEVYVPKAVPLGQWMYVVFSQYGSEETTLCPYDACGYFSRDYTNTPGWDADNHTCEPDWFGVPAAWFNPVTLSIDDSKDPAVTTLAKAFDTGDQWMTVAIPLTEDYFRYNVSMYNLPTTDLMKSCGHLTKNDFGNFLIQVECTGFQSQAAKGFGGKCFVGVDNFRIVPDDGGGVRFSKYYGATPASKYPF